MEGAAPLCRALIGLSVMVLVGGLRLISQGEDCSQPGIQCTINSSSCFDFSWFQSYIWTPSAPSTMEVTVGIGQNEMGRIVPVLQINWNVSTDSSILLLQGAEISVLEISTQINRCVQFQFHNPFPRQHNPNGQPWQFYYNNFEVTPGYSYYVTVQHLPKLEGVNSKQQTFTVPLCDRNDDLKNTDTCCDLGYCGYPNIEIKHQGENLIVEFSSRRDAWEYGVEVKVSNELSKYEHVYIEQGLPVQRKAVTFPGIGGYIDKECLYTISVWPYMPTCGTDCRRFSYTPPCATEIPPPPEPVERWYLWFVAVLLTTILFGGILLALRVKDCIHTPVKPDPEPPSFAPPTRRKVWLVYSADHRYYVDVVIKLADYMRLAWGLDVVLDRLHSQEMATTGSMAWLNRQKDEIKKTNGTILILCSRGVQEKWKAMQNVEVQRITLREDRKHPIKDLFTPAFALILPDFQDAIHYDRYLVAYFSSISTLEDIPEILKLCPSYSLTENLQDVFFRIQRQEQHQPHAQLTLSYKDHPSYQHLVKTMESCRKWQECNSGWFEKECLIPVKDLENTEEEEEEAELDENVTRKVYPIIRYPETSVSVMEPLILKPDPVKVLDPTIVIGTPSVQVEPFVSESDTSVSIVQPLFQEVASAVVCIQEPYLVGKDPSLGELSGLQKQDVSIQSDQGVLSIEQLRKAQERFFQNLLENPDLSSAMEFMDAPGQDVRIPIVDVARDQPVGDQFLDGPLMTPAMIPGTSLPDGHSIQLADQGYNTWDPYEMDLKAIQMESLKLFMQNEGAFLNFEQV